MSTYTLSQLARDSGISIHIIRDYVLRGLLQPVSRTTNGYQLFDESSLRRLLFLRAAFEAGIGLPALTRFCHALDAARLPAEQLELELTDSVAFGDPGLFATFDTLRALGVRFTADDFGTGYSCLQELKCCPIVTLKIDQSFVARPQPTDRFEDYFRQARSVTP